MKPKISLASRILLYALAMSLVSSIAAQNLTVREIMAEPSIAGMRVEAEKLSPDGTKVVYLWNAEGKLPCALYMVPTNGGQPQIILRLSDLPKPAVTPTPENKLDYDLTVRDDFAKARENPLGNFEWSPDSRKLVFSYGGDIYVMNAEIPSSPTLMSRISGQWHFVCRMS